MANQFMTRQEVVLNIGIPWLRASCTAAHARFQADELVQSVIEPNAFRDSLPIAIDRQCVGSAKDYAILMERLDQMERSMVARRVQRF